MGSIANISAPSIEAFDPPAINIGGTILDLDFTENGASFTAEGDWGSVSTGVSVANNNVDFDFNVDVNNV